MQMEVANCLSSKSEKNWVAASLRNSIIIFSSNLIKTTMDKFPGMNLET
jgi:hypothetical protein